MQALDITEYLLARRNSTYFRFFRFEPRITCQPADGCRSISFWCSITYPIQIICKPLSTATTVVDSNHTCKLRRADWGGCGDSNGNAVQVCPSGLRGQASCPMGINLIKQVLSTLLPVRLKDSICIQGQQHLATAFHADSKQGYYPAWKDEWHISLH